MNLQHGPYPLYFDDESNPHRQTLTNGEEILVIVLKLGGIAFWSLTISKLIRSMTVLGNPALLAYQQDVDAVNRFCAFNGLPSKLTRELRRYIQTTAEVHQQRSRAMIYTKLSPLLVTKITRQLNRPLFDSAFIKRALRVLPLDEGEKFVSALVTASTMTVYAPGDRPAGHRLCIITEGVAIRLGQVLTVGDSWGDGDVLLTHPPKQARETKAVTCMCSMDSFLRACFLYLYLLSALRHAASVFLFDRFARHVAGERCIPQGNRNRLSRSFQRTVRWHFARNKGACSLSETCLTPY
jgi:hypothetical protein